MCLDLQEGSTVYPLLYSLCVISHCVIPYQQLYTHACRYCVHYNTGSIDHHPEHMYNWSVLNKLTKKESLIDDECNHLISCHVMQKNFLNFVKPLTLQNCA